MIYSPLRNQILEALAEEPRLTARQIARLLHGEQHLTSYHKTNAMLNRMVDEKILIKLSRPHATLDYMFALKGKRKPLALSNYDHELSCGNTYVSFKASGALEEWTYCPRLTGIDPDRKARLAGIRQDLYLEIDRGTEPLWKIENKI